jgi:conjugative transposon TraN protein
MLAFFNRIYISILLSSFFAWFAVSAQDVNPTTIDITYSKTSNVVFPSAITTVDRGSRDVLVQKAKGVENVLLIKAGRRNFNQTNLTVITSDGKLHSLLINYTNEPTTLQWKIGSETPAIIFSETYGKATLHRHAGSILEKENRKSMLKRRSGKVSLGLNAIYVDRKVMYYHLTLANESNIDYDVESLRFYVRDKMKSKRTASQEIELSPLFVLEDVKRSGVPGQATIASVFALEKVTIPDSKRFYIEMMEKNGGRHLKLSLKNRNLVRAAAVPAS